MRDYNIYLCGGMGKFGKDNFEEGNNWRIYCKKILENYKCDFKIRVCNPNDYYNFKDEPPAYNSQLEVMKFDLHKLRKSDLVIVNFNDMCSLGSMSEMAIAYDRDIPIIGINIDKKYLHPWQTCMCEKIFYDIDEMLNYVKNYYLT